MAFVRWRGHCAELLTTVYERGRSRQLRLALLPPHHADAEVRAEVAARFPDVSVDWEAVDVVLARGAPADQAERAADGWPDDPLEWCHLQRRLHYWAALTETRQPSQAQILRAAAAILSQWRGSPPVVLQKEPEKEPAPGGDREPVEARPARHGERCRSTGIARVQRATTGASLTPGVIRTPPAMGSSGHHPRHAEAGCDRSRPDQSGRGAARSPTAGDEARDCEQGGSAAARS